ncbi:MAG TPA: Crp/Fnr family transcriptional regulator [Xanthomonadales bacterium]|nr:Crp/Fnr family transcriptional regulator [Xanthomonadales bacterium]
MPWLADFVLRESGLIDTREAPKINYLIASLPLKERQRILRLCQPVDLVFGATLCEVDEPFQHAYFPVTGLISLVTTSNDHQPLAVAMIGNEGLLGTTLALGINTPRLRGVVHGSGAGLRITAPRLRRVLRDSPGLLRALNRYSYVLMGQLLQTASCNAFHEVEMRLARWLLMTDDRSNSEHLQLTHQFLADLLGVQRSAVTIAAGKLQRKKIIGYARGHVSILSRSGLENASCECYGMQVRDHARQFADWAGNEGRTKIR